MSKTTRPEAPSKNVRILLHLLTGATLNRFEAEKLGDHCLNSTISELANRHGLAFTRQPERVPNRWGKPCRVIRYGLPPSETAIAKQVLARLDS
ncbi:hypothetical protein AUR61_001470 [Stutzerimonas balearica]|nr:hypothetical protein AUR61_001470 [Stutzerimonas balearica]